MLMHVLFHAGSGRKIAKLPWLAQLLKWNGMNKTGMMTKVRQRAD